MGAHVAAPTRTGSSVVAKIVIALLYLIIGPLLALAGVLMLVVIAMMICLNLIFLTLWLAVIHWAFAQDWAKNIHAFVGFVEQVIQIFSRGR